MKERMRNLIMVVFVLVFCLQLFGCASSRRDASISAKNEFICTYSSELNKTKIEWDTTIKNYCVYNILREDIYVDIYMSNGSAYGNQKYTYSLNVNYASVKNCNLYFYVE